jgi:hypothetical protein
METTKMVQSSSTFNYPQNFVVPGATGFFVLGDVLCGDLDLIGINGPPNCVWLHIEISPFTAQGNEIPFATPEDATAFFNAVQIAIKDRFGDDNLFTYTRQLVHRPSHWRRVLPLQCLTVRSSCHSFSSELHYE